LIPALLNSYVGKQEDEGPNLRLKTNFSLAFFPVPSTGKRLRENLSPTPNLSISSEEDTSLSALRRIYGKK
jgi:hypothetical protein